MAMQNRIGEAFDLQLVRVGVRSQRSMKLSILYRKTFNFARFMKPWQKQPALCAAVFAIESEAFFEIALNRYGQFEVGQRAISELRLHEPTKRSQFLQAAHADSSDFSGQKAGSIDHMTAMRQHKVPTFIRLG